MSIIHKGTIVVRTGYARSDRRPEQEEGALFATTGESDHGSALYANSMSISSNNFRLATKEEIEMYRIGVRNLSRIVNSSMNNFCVHINHDKFLLDIYRKLCLKYDIKYNIHWSGTATYYGIKNEITLSSNSQWGQMFTLNELKKKLINKINKQNETNGIITTKQGRKNIGTAITSNKKRQVATTSRPRGNGISTRIGRTRAIKSKISFGTISY